MSHLQTPLPPQLHPPDPRVIPTRAKARLPHTKRRHLFAGHVARKAMSRETVYGGVLTKERWQGMRDHVNAPPMQGSVPMLTSSVKGATGGMDISTIAQLT